MKIRISVWNTMHWHRELPEVKLVVLCAFFMPYPILQLTIEAVSRRENPFALTSIY